MWIFEESTGRLEWPKGDPQERSDRTKDSGRLIRAEWWFDAISADAACNRTSVKFVSHNSSIDEL